MRVARLHLDEFRVYRSLDLALPPAGLRLAGGNASGKTSLLEAIYLLSTGRSPRASLDRDLINWSSNAEYGLAPYARAVAELETVAGPRQVEMALTVEPERTATRKRVKVDGVARRAIDAVGVLKAVLFEPEDLALILGSPAGRRRHLDIALSQLDPAYLQALSRYLRLLQQRNSLLKDLGQRRVQGAAEAELSYWDESLVTYGSYVLAARLRYVQGLGELAAGAFEELAGGKVRLEVEYATSLDLAREQEERIRELPLLEAQALVARTFERAVAARRDEELRRGVTVVGPHRDDLRFALNGRELAAYGSRGQQRLAVVATKLAELRQMVRATGERPVLLLDDVLSELDQQHRDRLLFAIGAADAQVLVTATEPGLLDHPRLAGLPLLLVAGGEVRDAATGGDRA